MRIDGSYLFPAPPERLFTALLRPETLARAIPAVERLIQLGPPDDDGGVTFKAWLRAADSAGSAGSAGGLAVLTWCLTPVRRPESLRVRLWGHLPGGHLDASGTIDLVAREDAHARGAYALELEAPEGALDIAAVQSLASALCERLATLVYRPEAEAESAPGVSPSAAEDAAGSIPTAASVPESSPPWTHVITPHGRIVALPPRKTGAARVWAERALWMGAGLALGLAAVGLVLAVAHRFNGPDT